MTVACHSNYPSISLSDFMTFAQESELSDNLIAVDIIEAQFVASRKEDDGKHHHKSSIFDGMDLNRFEFIECLVRIANFKYK